MEKLLGKEVYNIISKNISFTDINEIRLRIDRPILVKTLSREFFIEYHPTKEYLRTIIQVATGNSMYAHEKEMSDGYLEYGDGIRIGICGFGRINDKKLIAFSEYYALCIRIPHICQVKNDFEIILNNPVNTLIIGPHFSGKTTLIRYLANRISENHDVVIIDERKELAGKNGSFLPGKRADIIQGIEKKYVFSNIIRSMAPEIIVCDELFDHEDIVSVKRIIYSGIKCLASYHSENKTNVPNELRKLFQAVITLSSKPRPGSILSIEIE